MTIASASTSPDITPFIARFYRPMIRGYFGVTAVYYIVMTLIHFRMQSGTGVPTIAIASISASIVFTLAWYALHNSIGLARLPIVLSIANLLMLTNVMIAMEADFAQENLVYFIIMVMMFAFACTSITQALVSIAAVLAGLFYVLVKHAPEQLTIYGFITFSASMSSISITFFMRRALGLPAFARFETENRLRDAEKLGEKMRQRSLSDSLTGLPNRRAFFETLKSSKREAGSGDARWLVLVDLDGFKAVNDGYGHLVGDEL